MKAIRNLYRFLFVQYKWISLSAILTLIFFYTICLPHPLFQDPISTVLEDRNGELLGAQIAKDGQWRFPQIDSVPDKYEQAVITFEDKRFYKHFGVDLRALGRAVMQNIRSKRKVSGGSTLSMQVIRLSRKGKSRTVWQKLIELILATRLEFRYSKSEILSLYASYAPFGGNVVGLDAASWRYYGKEPSLLSWSEAATLAVLPNSPALIHPGRNRSSLLSKRNRLLNRLHENGHFDKTTLELSMQEPIPEKPLPLPRFAPHLLDRIQKEILDRNDQKASRIRTSIDRALQNEIIELGQRRSQLLKHNEIHNLAILVVDVKSKETLAYLGNAPYTGREHGESVDIIKALRSTGSILKPFLYAKMIENGELLPEQLVPDIPMYLNDYRPSNYLNTYDGAVSAKRALARSLNIPFIKLLQEYGVERFHYDLNKLGFTTINRPPENYGLTLILGGAEANLWDLTSTYAGMALRLANFYEQDGRYSNHDFQPISYLLDSSTQNEEKLTKSHKLLGAGAIWLTLKAMENVERPSEEGDWRRFDSSKKVAWKTGTSIGFRDAWAVGITPEFAVGVWVGNADGEGRPGLVGIQAAAPILFDVFAMLPETTWFEVPYDDMKQLEVCKKSGFLAKQICPKDTIWTASNVVNYKTCSYHKKVFVDQSGRWQVNTDCYPNGSIEAVPWFVLPTLEEHYYKRIHPSYLQLPAFHPGCQSAIQEEQVMAMVYPNNLNNIIIPLELDGSKGKTVFQATHRQPQVKIHWHLDEIYLETTQDFHAIEISPSVGEHWITLVDEEGQRLRKMFRVLENESN